MGYTTGEKLFIAGLSKARYKNSSELFEKLLDLDYAVIKGEVVSYQTLNRFGSKASSDIDILIDKADLKAARKILNDNGFFSNDLNRNETITLMAFSHQYIPFTKVVNNVNIEIDVNFDLFWGEYVGKRVNIRNFLADTETMQIYDCDVKTLPVTKSFIHLVLHHYKEMNSLYHLAKHDSINVQMFNEVYNLLKNNINIISCEKLFLVCKEYEIMPYVYYVLYFTDKIFKDYELTEYIEKLKTDEGVKLLNCFGLTEQERKPWTVDFESRLNEKDLFSLIKNQLTDDDDKKIERNIRIFG